MHLTTHACTHASTHTLYTLNTQSFPHLFSTSWHLGLYLEILILLSTGEEQESLEVQPPDRPSLYHMAHGFLCLVVFNAQLSPQPLQPGPHPSGDACWPSGGTRSPRGVFCGGVCKVCLALLTGQHEVGLGREMDSYCGFSFLQPSHQVYSLQTCHLL